MAPDGAYVYEGLLSHNYFPMVKERRDDICPLFTTESLIPEVADSLGAHYENLSNPDKRSDGFDQIEYRTTRFNNILRLMHIPHPLPFSRLCKSLREHWLQLAYICENEHSQIKPERHDDGRVYVVDDYEEVEPGRIVVIGKEKFPDEVERHLNLSLGATYYVDADVSSCFPSLYTHAIPWALVGHPQAKENRSQSEWYNQLDERQRHLKRNETQGVPVGPATSNIMNEIILARVDSVLAESYRFVRYIDDYKCYCETKEKAEKFIRELEHELSKYLLSVNARKVSIESLPIPTKAEWVTELLSHIPRSKPVSHRDIINVFDAAIRLQGLYPNGSVLKYAARALSSKLTEAIAPIFCKYTINLAFHHPVVIPIVCDVVKRYSVVLDINDIEKVASRQILYRRSDMTCWMLYLMAVAGIDTPESYAESVVKWGDCMAMAALLAIDQHQDKIVKHVNNLDASQNYELDKHWLLAHELMMRGESFGQKIKDYAQNSGLSLLANHSVSFLSDIGGEGAE